MPPEIDPFKMPPQGVPPAADPATEQARQEAARQAGSTDLSGLGDLAQVGIEGGAEAISAAADVGGEVVGGALEALGGCSSVLAFIIVLATAGTALAMTW